MDIFAQISAWSFAKLKQNARLGTAKNSSFNEYQADIGESDFDSSHQKSNFNLQHGSLQIFSQKYSQVMKIILHQEAWIDSACH